MSLPKEYKVCVWNETDGLKDFIGCGKEGNLDGRALQCELYQSIGICVEFDNVVYVADCKPSLYQNHVNNDEHRKVFVPNWKVDAGVLYTREKR